MFARTRLHTTAKILVVWISISSCGVTDPRPPIAAVIWESGFSALGPPAVDDLAVYFATRYHTLVALSRSTGALRWSVHCCVGGDDLTTYDIPARAADVVIYGDQELVAYDVNTGAQRWILNNASGVEPQAGIYPYKTDATTVYAGSTMGTVFAMDAATGVQRWRTDLVARTDTTESQVRVLAIGDGRIYATVRFGSLFLQGRVYALNTADGAVAWSYDLGTNVIAHDGAYAPGGNAGPLFVTGLDDGRLVALAAATGEPRWFTPRPSPFYGSGRGLSVTGDVIVTSPVFSPDYVAAYDVTTGAERWRTMSDYGSAGGVLQGSVSSDATTAYVVFNNGVLGAYDIATGALRWYRKAPEGFFVDAPTIRRDTLFLGAYNAAYAIYSR